MFCEELLFISPQTGTVGFLISDGKEERIIHGTYGSVRVG